MIFDDVLIPWERIFLMRKPKEANALFRSRVMAWAGYASVLQLIARLELIIGTAHLIAETGGIAKRPHVTLEMGELVSYAGMFKGLLRAAEVDCMRTPGGHYMLGDTAHLRPLIAHDLRTHHQHLRARRDQRAGVRADRRGFRRAGAATLARCLWPRQGCRCRLPAPAVPARLGADRELVRRPPAALRAAALGLARGHHQRRLSALRQEQGHRDGQHS